MTVPRCVTCGDVVRYNNSKRGNSGWYHYDFDSDGYSKTGYDHKPQPPEGVTPESETDDGKKFKEGMK